jgi:hypothetical protein
VVVDRPEHAVTSSAARHPIVDLAMQALVLTAGAPPRFDDAKKPALAAALAALKHEPGLKEAVAELLYFAAFLELQEHAPAAADAVLDVARTAIPYLDAQGIVLDDVLKDGAAATKMGALLQNAESKVPVGQRGAAPGAVKWWQVQQAKK